MKPEFESYHLIDRYLRDELSPEEREDFNRELAENPDFAEEVAFQREVNELISVNSYAQLREQMTQDIHMRDKNLRLKKWLGGGLALTTLLVASTYFLMDDKKDEVRSVVANTEKKPHSEKVPGTDSVIRQVTAQPDTIVSNSKPVVPAITDTEQVAESHGKNERDQDTMKNIVTDRNKNEILQQESPDRQTITATNSGDSLVPVKIIEPENVKATVHTPVPEPDLVNNNPCEEVAIHIPFTVEKACTGQNNGKIQVKENEIRGGTKPYEVELFQGISRISSIQYDHLYPGSYTLKVTDKQGCTNSHEIRVDEKFCQPRNVSIAPNYGEVWEYHGNEGDSYYLSILNQAGQLVYKSALLTGNTTWAGTFTSGAPVEAGLYIYIVEYTNGKKENGQITIVR